MRERQCNGKHDVDLQPRHRGASLASVGTLRCKAEPSDAVVTRVAADLLTGPGARRRIGGVGTRREPCAASFSARALCKCSASRPPKKERYHFGGEHAMALGSSSANRTRRSPAAIGGRGTNKRPSKSLGFRRSADLTGAQLHKSLGTQAGSTEQGSVAVTSRSSGRACVAVSGR